MKRRFARILLVFLFPAVGILLFAWYTSPSRRINRATFEQIKEGMTTDEVVALIGYPPGIYGSKRMGVMSQFGPTKKPDLQEYDIETMRMTMNAMATSLPGNQRMDFWTSKGGCILIVFQDGVVAQMEYAEVVYEGRHVLEDLLTGFR